MPNKKVALVRRPSANLTDGIVTHMDRVPVDVDRALAQHAEYCAALAGAGWHIQQVDPAPEHPDAVFVEDSVVVVGDTAVITRSGAPSRRGETEGTTRAVTELGLATVHITAPATLDGGDVLQVGNIVYVGRGGRTNSEGIRQLQEAVRALGRVVVPVRLLNVLHLKSAVTALPDGTFLAAPGLLEPGVFPPGRPIREEAGCHVVPLGEDEVLISASAPGTTQDLRDLGFRTRVVDISEFEKLEGCVTCLSVLVRGGPGAGAV